MISLWVRFGFERGYLASQRSPSYYDTPLDRLLRLFIKRPWTDEADFLRWSVDDTIEVAFSFFAPRVMLARLYARTY